MSFRSVAGLSGFAVHSVRSAPNRDIWIGTDERGVARIDARTGKVAWFGERQGLAGRAVYKLRFDREQRLVGSHRSRPLHSHASVQEILAHH